MKMPRVTTSSNPPIVIEWDYDASEMCQTASDNLLQRLDIEDPETAAIYSRINEPSIPLWMVLHCPGWFVNFCFWVKRTL